ncbi:hypothetical protein HBB16_06205 [Pseudonocardia sp. MCCB 268]|nr:hypothetical protein [Pseudonocardia cytotoxica]
MFSYGFGAAPAAADASPRGPVMLTDRGAVRRRSGHAGILPAITVGLVGGTVTAFLAGLMTPAGIVSAKDGTAEGFLDRVEDMLPLIGVESPMVFGMPCVLQAAGVRLVVTRSPSPGSAGSPPAPRWPSAGPVDRHRAVRGGRRSVDRTFGPVATASARASVSTRTAART